MRRISWILVALFGFAGLAQAQDASTATATGQFSRVPRWDVGASAGLLSANPQPSTDPYSSDWFFTGRYAVSIGRYWTTHLKTELEVATSNDAERYVQRYSSVPGVPPTYTYTARERHTLRQVSGRTVWQFFDNAWAHPYVFGGVVYEADRVDTFVSPQYYLPDPRSPLSRVTVTPPNDGPKTVHRVGVTGGFGAKVYFSPNAFFNTALVVSYARPATTASVLGGFGVDF